MGERLLCKQEVIGSIPFTSTDPGTDPGGAVGRGGLATLGLDQGFSDLAYGIRRRPGLLPRSERRAVRRARLASGAVLIERVKRICECDRGGWAAGAG